MKTIDHERLLEVICYNAGTGEFSWKVNRPGHLKNRLGTAAGVSGSRRIRYLKIGIDGKQFLAHRLAWFYVHKEWPPEVDHVNGDGLDNRIANLRAATRAQNSTNALAQKSNKTGYRGVHRHPGSEKFRAQISKNGKTRSLGYFKTAEDAYQAYLSAAREVHGEFVRCP